MRLTFENFFSHLIFNPFEADKKRDIAIALVASIACGVFSIGLCHVACLIRKSITHKPEATGLDGKINRLIVRPFPKSEIKSEIEVTIPTEVKSTLDNLFKDSPYSIDKLLVYSTILDKEHPSPERKKMTAPVMKGITDDGRPFIAIKVDCDLEDEDIEKYQGYEEMKNYYRNNRKLEDVLVLGQYRPSGTSYWTEEKEEYMWNQLSGLGSYMRPQFFTWNFTYKHDGMGPTEGQKDNFNLVQTLLKTGESPDTNKLVWRISTNRPAGRCFKPCLRLPKVPHPRLQF